MPFKAGLGTYDTNKLNLSDTSSDDDSESSVEINSNSTHAHAAIKSHLDTLLTNGWLGKTNKARLQTIYNHI
eukprot:54625-Ditylum_brightwellii.AAC.1